VNVYYACEGREEQGEERGKKKRGELLIRGGGLSFKMRRRK